MFQETAKVCEGLLHEFFASAARTVGIAVGLQKKIEDVLFYGRVGADCGPGAVEFVDVPGGEPSFHFLDGCTADELWGVRCFKIGAKRTARP